MKKVLLVLGLLIISQNFVQAETPATSTTKPEQPVIATFKPHKETPFEIRLGLTEQQKMQAREIRYKGHENLFPIVNQIRMLRQEAQMVKNSRIAVQVQEERLAKIDKELKKLEKQAHKIKKQNMKEFESILTKAQRNTLKQMKQEGRKKYHSEHPTKMQMMQQTTKK